MNSATVEASHLGKTFGSKRVLQDLSFGVAPGDVIGVLGKNGAGKTTLLELMLGFTQPSEGAIRVFGHDSFRLPGDAKARVGFVPQQDELLDDQLLRAGFCGRCAVRAQYIPRLLHPRHRLSVVTRPLSCSADRWEKNDETSQRDRVTSG